MRRYVGLLLLLFFAYSFAADVYHVFPDQMVFVGQHGLPETQLPQNIRVVGYIYNPSGDVSVNDALNVDSGTLYVDASNNRVGIGTTSPGGKLEIAKVAVSANEDALRIGIDEEYDARIKFFDDDDESNQYAQIIYGAGSNKFYLYNKEAGIVIDPSGNVGVGIASPSQKLHVYHNSATDVAALVENDYSGKAAYLKTDANSLYSAYVSISNVPQTWIVGQYGSSNFVIRDQTGLANPLVIEAGTPTNTLYLDSSGNVGVSAPNPSYKIDVSGTGRFTGDLHIATGQSTGYLYIDSSNDAFIYHSEQGQASDAWLFLEPKADTGYNAIVGMFRTSQDATPRFRIMKGDGTTGIGIEIRPREELIQFGTDVVLYRSASNVLKTDDSLEVGGNIIKSGGEIQDSRNTAYFLRSTTNGANSWIFREHVASWGVFHYNHDDASRCQNSILLTRSDANKGIDSAVCGDIPSGTEATILFDLANGEIEAKKFLDLDDTTYYLDPSSTGTSLNVAGSIDVAGTAYLNGIALDNDADITGADQIIGYNDLRLYGDSSGGPDIYISSGGNVGIGTSSPSYKLDVNGQVRITDDIIGSEGFSMDNDATNVYDDSTSNSPYSRVSADSFHTNGLGVGQMYIEGRAIDANTWICIGCGLAGGQSAQDVKIGNNNEIYVDTSADKVGVGTSSPSYKLDVSGTIRAADVFSAGGKNLIIGDDVYLTDIDAANTLGIYGMQDSTKAKIKLGSDGPTLSGYSGFLGIGTDYPGTPLDVYSHTSGTAAAHFKNDVDDVYCSIAYGSYAFVCSGTKSFITDHPTKPGMKLVHSAIEGPENAVYYRGEGQLVNGRAVIHLPEYFEGLTKKEGRTVLVTPVFEREGEKISQLAVSPVKDGKFIVIAIDDNNPNQKFYWEVKAVRADLPDLVVEQPAENFPE